jgi:hypothetical protein
MARSRMTHERQLQRGIAALSVGPMQRRARAVRHVKIVEGYSRSLIDSRMRSCHRAAGNVFGAGFRLRLLTKRRRIEIAIIKIGSNRRQ